MIFSHTRLQSVAAFDFDNTLTKRDSLLPFLFYLHGYIKTCYLLLSLLPSFVHFIAGNISRQEIKEKILTRFIGGMPLKKVEAAGKEYADKHLDCLLKQTGMQRLSWHHSQGHCTLLVSASPEFYLIPWARRHGFEAVLASRLETTEDGMITGRLIGLNCWGAEKRARLSEYLKGNPVGEIYAYGDSQGDREMLDMAHFPFYRSFED